MVRARSEYLDLEGLAGRSPAGLVLAAYGPCSFGVSCLPENLVVALLVRLDCLGHHRLLEEALSEEASNAVHGRMTHSSGCGDGSGKPGSTNSRSDY